MISEKVIDKLVERLTLRIEKANLYFLNSIGESINKIGELSPSKAHELVQILKYGGNYQKIINEISRLTNLNIKDIDTIFEEYAKKDQLFYKQFYQYRNVPFVEYANNKALIKQTMALANISKGIMSNFAKTSSIGYSIRDLKGNIVFKGIKETYYTLLDQALLNVGQGKETFDQSMKNILKELGGSGLRTLDYENGRSIRLDSAVRMHLKSSLRELHNENQKLYGEEFGSDGVEISVHENPAPDHEDAQGHIFTNEEFDRLQSYGIAKDINNTTIDMHRNELSSDFRPISELNCYHYTFSIVIGASKPEYTLKQLEEIKERNQKGFDIVDKHYTNYQGTQMQRQLELRIRKERDVLALAKSSGNQALVRKTNEKITKYKMYYKELSDLSGLRPKMKRLR